MDISSYKTNEILTNEEMQKLEQYVFNEVGIKAEILMERAALSIFEWCCKKYPDSLKSISVICGNGNNGADGYAIARLFYLAGYTVQVFNRETDRATPLNQMQADILRKIGLKITIFNEVDFNNTPHTLIIDAVLGTGITTKLQSDVTNIIKTINAESEKNKDLIVVSVDIPSGLSGSTHLILKESVKASSTITFCRKKLCHAMFPAKKYCGHIHVADIGIPDNLVAKYASHYESSYPQVVPLRDDSCNKSDYGFTAILGGSCGKTGAAVMASIACLRSGAGRVTAIIPRKCSQYFAPYPEIMTDFVNEQDGFGCIDPQKEALHCISLCANKNAVAIGPGLGRDKRALQFVKEFIKMSEFPLIIDADALYALDADVLKHISKRAVLTPHPGEFAAMTGITVNEVLNNPLELSRQYAVKNRVHLVLKNADTIITTPEGLQIISNHANSALAKGGSGDILTGITLALVAQKYTLTQACLSASYILGEAALRSVKTRKSYSCIPADIINNIGV